MNTRNISVLTAIPRLMRIIWNSATSFIQGSESGGQTKIQQLEKQIAELEAEKKAYFLNKMKTDKSCTACREIFLKDFQLHRSIIDNPVDMIIFAVDQQYRYTAFSKYYNETTRRIFNAEASVGMNILEHINDKVYRSIAKQNLDRAMNGEYFVHYEEFMFEKQAPAFCNCYHSPIKNADNEVVGVLVFMVNITEVVNSKLSAMRSEEKLIVSEERYRTIADNITDGILYADQAHNIQYLSPSYNQQLGYEPEEVVFSTLENIFAYVHPQEKDDLTNLFKVAVESQKKKTSYTYRIKNKEGEYIWREDNTHFKFDEVGNYSGLFTISRDITDRKKVEAALNEALIKSQASNRLRTSFIQNISHEVRTPLNGILGFGSLLSEPGLSDELKEEYSQLLNISSARLLNTITDYLDAAQIEAGSLEIHPVPVNIHELVQKLIPVHADLCKKKNLVFKLSRPEQYDIIVYTDPDLLRKCITELLDNAIKFTNSGTICLEYAVKDQQVTFLVKDTGIGISPDAIELVFEPFMHENADRLQGYEGNGLGLSITKGFLKRLGGTITVESEKGKGSSFFFSIPLNNESPTAKKDMPDTEKTKKPAKLEILIAEDDLMSDLYLEIMLKPYASKIYKAANGIEAVQRCREHPGISLVMVDLKMPLMNGLEATREIKSIKKDMLVIAVTAYALIEDKKAAYDAGVDDFMAKPVSKADITEMLDRYGLLS